jgi:hypothetical protein
MEAEVRADGVDVQLQAPGLEALLEAARALEPVP